MPRSRVWRAITDAREFGAWFGVTLEGAFAEGVAVLGKITSPGYEHLTIDVLVERIEPHALSDAGLVRDTRRGREHICELEPRRLEKARRCLDQISDQWDAAIGRLKAS